MERATVIIGGTDGPGGCVAKADRAALELAVERFPAKPHVYCVARDEAAFRYAAAAGAEQVGLLTDLETIDSPFVLVGPASLSGYGDWLPAMLAERLAAALVFEVLDIVAADEDSLVLVRDLGHGERDELEVRGPAVLVISDNATPRRYVSRYRQRFAPISLPAADARGMVDPLHEIGGVWGPMRPRVRAGANAQVMTLSIEDRVNTYCGVQTDGSSENELGRPIQADAATCAAHLLRYLSHHGLLPDAMLPSSRPDHVLWHDLPTVPHGSTAGLQRVPETSGRADGGVGRPAPNEGERESASHESGAPDPHNAACARRPRLLEGNDAVRRRRQPRLLSPSRESSDVCATNGTTSRVPEATGNECSAFETTHDKPLTTHNAPLTTHHARLTAPHSPRPRRREPNRCLTSSICLLPSASAGGR